MSKSLRILYSPSKTNEEAQAMTPNADIKPVNKPSYAIKVGRCRSCFVLRVRLTHSWKPNPYKGRILICNRCATVK